MKLIECCGDCAYYDWKKHRCSRGAHKDTVPPSKFFADCPLPEPREPEIECEIPQPNRWLDTV